MSGAPRGLMDPTNPRWDTSDVRFRRQKLFWAVIASGAAALAASTMIVVSCLGRGQAHREPDQLTIIETTASPPQPTPAMTIVIAPLTQAPPATAAAANDSTGGPNDRTAPASTTNVTSAPVVQRSPSMDLPAAVVAAPAPAPPAVRAPTDTSSGVPQQGSPEGATPNVSASTTGLSTSTQAAPTSVIGAGAFNTDAPPNAGSSFQSNPEAGAGPFQPAR